MIRFLMIVFSINLLISCATPFTTATSNRWVVYELPPSNLKTNGSVFFEGNLSDGTKFSVFFDASIDMDGEHYYAMLMQDWGWSRSGNTWSAPQGSRNVKRGYIYINPRRGVAVYFYPEKHFSAFKLSMKSS